MDTWYLWLGIVLLVLLFIGGVHGGMRSGEDESHLP